MKVTINLKPEHIEILNSAIGGFGDMNPKDKDDVAQVIMELIEQLRYM